MVLRCRFEVPPEPGVSTWAAPLWLWRLLRRRGAVFRTGGLVGRANCGAWPAGDGMVVVSEGTAIGGELTIAEELIGFHKLAG